jgi:hypothetical protein
MAALASHPPKEPNHFRDRIIVKVDAPVEEKFGPRLSRFRH